MPSQDRATPPLKMVGVRHFMNSLLLTVFSFKVVAVAKLTTICGALLLLCICICMTTCGGSSSTATSSSNDSCSGVVISGTLQDSLTSAPISRASAVLESGTQLLITRVYNFFPTQTVTPDAQGAFRLCPVAITNPSALVITAMDSSGNAYPPFVAPVSGSADLGTILMGSCRGICGFEGQQQTSVPANISGVITSTPIGKKGQVLPQYVMNGLDGSNNLWGLAMPTFNTSQAYTFSTTAGSCGGAAPFCAAYSFTVPSQRPIQRVNDGYLQESAVPYYAIYAVVDGTPSCTPPFALEIYQQDGASLLTGAPGVQLSASIINFTACQ
jgi:hypothetical protein